jgi:hypothetical protein
MRSAAHSPVAPVLNLRLASINALIVHGALPSSRLLMKMNVRGFSVLAPSSIKAPAAERASSVISLRLSKGSNPMIAFS